MIVSIIVKFVLKVKLNEKIKNTFLAWQYSFSMTFPKTHGRRVAPVAGQLELLRKMF